MSSNNTLSDIGEFSLLEQVVLPTVGNSKGVTSLGDDCAFIKLPSGQHELVVTTDVAPQPLSWHLGYRSYHTWGWYAVMINVSDLAAAGASPLAITTSIEAPSDMLVSDFKEFFEGIADASQEHSIANAGGNIRARSAFACHGTAIGTISSGARLRRNGAQPGDIIVSVGQCGRFASAYLRAKQSGFDNLSIDEQAILIRPVARIREMQLLHSRGLVTAASDNSDGVLGAIWNISEGSKCTIEIDMLPETLPDDVIKAASEFGYDPWNLMFFWGDWQIIAAIASNKAHDFWSVVKEFNIPVQRLGRCSKGSPQILGVRGEHKQRLKLLRNENFVHTSFNLDLDTHIEFMLSSCLYLGNRGNIG